MSRSVSEAASDAPDAPVDAPEAVTATDPPDTVDSTAEALTDVDAYRPLPVKVEHPDDIYLVLDRADEEQIIDELAGRQLDVFLYDFTSGGKRHTDLSYAGVREAVRTLNARGHTRIRIANQPPLIEDVSEDGEQFHRVTVYAEDEATGGGQWGTAVEPKHMKLKNGKTKWDKFALTKALNKAQRNALKTQIPEVLRQMLIAQWLKDEKRVKQVRASSTGAEQLAELPPPLTDERAEAQKTKCRALYDELKEINRLILPPGAFNTYLARAEHSHDRLADFIEFLGQKIEEAKA